MSFLLTSRTSEQGSEFPASGELREVFARSAREILLVARLARLIANPACRLKHYMTSWFFFRVVPLYQPAILLVGGWWSQALRLMMYRIWTKPFLWPDIGWREWMSRCFMVLCVCPMSRQLRIIYRLMANRANNIAHQVAKGVCAEG